MNKEKREELAIEIRQFIAQNRFGLDDEVIHFLKRLYISLRFDE